MYTHLVEFEKYSEYFKMWLKGSFRFVQTSEDEIEFYQKSFSRKNYRNLVITTL